MFQDPVVNELADKQYLTLVIRLLVDSQGKLQQGGIVDLNERNVGKFRRLNELSNFIERWLEDWACGQSAADHDNSPQRFRKEITLRRSTMSVIIENLTNRPVLLPLNSGQTLHLAPRKSSPSLMQVEVEQNAKIEKLQGQSIIAVLKLPDVTEVTGNRTSSVESSQAGGGATSAGNEEALAKLKKKKTESIDTGADRSNAKGEQ